MTADRLADWSDDRLDAAFTARAAGRQMPHDLVESTLDRITSAAHSQSPRRPRAMAGLLAAGLTVAVIVAAGIVSIGRGDGRGTAGSELPTSSIVSSPSASHESAPSSTPAEPITLDVVDLGGRRVTVEIHDESGHLISAAPMTAGSWPANVPLPGTVEATTVDGQPNQVRIGWVGGACDTETRFTIHPDGRTIDMVTEGSPGFCILVGILRGVVLTFDEPTSAAEIEIVARSPGEVSPAPSSANFPSEVLGLPVISVQDALDHRERRSDDTELAVRGYWHHLPIEPIDGNCGLTQPQMPVLPYCTDSVVWLTTEPERPGTLVQPGGAKLQPLRRSSTYIGSGFVEDFHAGRPVVALGHFGDHRAAACSSEEKDTCRSSFVVDALLDPAEPSIDLRRIEAAAAGGVKTVAAPLWAESVVTEAPLGARPILAVFALRGANLTQEEPQTEGVAELTNASAVWIVRYLDVSADGRWIVRTKLVVDTPARDVVGRVYEPTPSGLVIATTIID
jgi:hypothetical protein